VYNVLRYSRVRFLDMIAIVGAGGSTGLECLRKLLADAKSVRAIVRSPEKYEGKFGAAEVVKGDVTDEATLKDAFANCKSVIFAASASAYKGAGGPYEVDYMGLQKTTAAAIAVGVEKLVVISSRLVNPKKRFHPIRVILNNIKYSLMDYKFLGEEFVRNSGMNYTIVRPGGLVGGEDGSGRKASFKPGTQFIVAAGPEGDVGSTSSIHRTDVAAVACEALSAPESKNKTIEIVSRTPVDGDQSFEERLRSIFNAIPQDSKM